MLTDLQVCTIFHTILYVVVESFTDQADTSMRSKKK